MHCEFSYFFEIFGLCLKTIITLIFRLSCLLVSLHISTRAFSQRFFFSFASFHPFLYRASSQSLLPHQRYFLHFSECGKTQPRGEISGNEVFVNRFTPCPFRNYTFPLFPQHPLSKALTLGLSHNPVIRDYMLT